MDIKPIRPSHPLTLPQVTKAVQLLNQFSQSMVSKMADYPPTQTHYRRTGTLGRNWTATPAHQVGSNMVATVTNNVEYMPVVQGKQQKGFHAAHGWKTYMDVAKDLWENIYRPAIMNVLRGK